MNQQSNRASPIARSRWAVPAVVVIATALRLPGLSRPGVLVFDEQYWVPNAVDLIQWGSTHGQFRHPPLGQWIIAAGIKAFGLTPFGWRVAALIMGVATVALVAATAIRLTRSQMLGFAAGAMCAFDGVMFTTSRVGMLDASAGFFVMLTTWTLVALLQAPQADHARKRTLQACALVACGLAGSVKWYGFFSLPIIAGLMLHNDFTIGNPTPRVRRFATSIVMVVGIPLIVYLASWAPQQFGPDAWHPRDFVSTHIDVARFHAHLHPDNTSAAPASTWFTMSHPTVFFAADCASPGARTTLGPCHGYPPQSGSVIVVQQNPMVWLVCLASLVGLAYTWAKQRHAIALVLLGIPLLQWLPWLMNGRAAYTFYLTTIIPTLLVGAAWLVGAKRGARLKIPIVASIAVAALLFWFFLPVWTGTVLTNNEIARRMWWWGLQ